MKRCLDCGYHTHSYVDGVPVCDHCGKGGKLKGQNKSRKCVDSLHNGCSGKCRLYAKGLSVKEILANYNKVPFTLVQCDCACHRGWK